MPGTNPSSKKDRRRSSVSGRSATPFCVVRTIHERCEKVACRVGVDLDELNIPFVVRVKIVGHQNGCVANRELKSSRRIDSLPVRLATAEPKKLSIADFAFV